MDHGDWDMTKLGVQGNQPISKQLALMVPNAIATQNALDPQKIKP